MQEIIFISVIIITYNRKDTLEKAIGSIFSQDYPESMYEIVVVDDGSTDGTEDLIKILDKEHSIVYFKQGRKGPAAARNLGIRNAKGKIIAFLDSDCIAPRDWLSTIAGLYKRHPETVSVGGSSESGPLKKSFINGFAKLVFYRPAPRQTEGYVNSVATRSLSFKKEIFQEIGYFDEVIGYPEDTEFNLRLNLKGYKIYYSPALTVMHIHPFDLFSCYKREFDIGRTDYKIHIKYPDFYIRAFRLPIGLINSIIFCAGVFIKPLLLLREYKILTFRNVLYLPFLAFLQIFRKAGIYYEMKRSGKKITDDKL